MTKDSFTLIEKELSELKNKIDSDLSGKYHFSQYDNCDLVEFQFHFSLAILSLRNYLRFL